ncbi:phytanoyl-CoA dioxygenase family protein [uncultured Sneathiella sp.]|uniref:phytanoyl-CoA dioxygenase family protein n=1 Tax=uncultured Sneathiella sp. TaxID=879315 RepID=UPI0030D6FF4C
MTDSDTLSQMSAEEHAKTMADYIKAGEARAYALGNRGPIRFGPDGKLHHDILDAYQEHGFYVFENVVGSEELAELRADVEDVLQRAPVSPESDVDALGRPALGPEFGRYPYRFAKPLSDPLGGTTKNKGRHPVKMSNPTPSKDAPSWTIELLHGNLHLMDSCLRLYGHPGLLAIAEAINGPDFVPYNEVAFIKEPGLGPSVAWHQDGTTHWDAPDWDENAHGFNFMTQLYPSTPANCVWLLPGSHRAGKVDIRKLVEESGSDRFKDAVPLVCKAGDVFAVNRQLVHGSFANSSPDRRVTINAGFFPRKRVLDVTTSQLDERMETYDAERIHARSRIIALGIDARQQRFPDEPRFCYQPLAGEEMENRWNEENREKILKNYNLNDIYI